MLTIQEVGLQILGGKPGKFYVFLGSEYGIKQKYIEHLIQYYKGNYVEGESVSNVLDMMNTKRLIPLVSTLYVIRYDETFLSSSYALNAANIEKTNIIGTIICIYENSKHAAKCKSLLDSYSVSIDAVNPDFIAKYLKSEFSQLDDRFLQLIATHSENYNQARNICYGLSSIPQSEFAGMNDSELLKVFGRDSRSTEDEFKLGIAAKDFSYCLKKMESLESISDSLHYAILSVMLQLDKLLDNPRSSSEFKQYVNNWNRPDVYNMFMQTYSQLNLVRSVSSFDIENSLIYLIGLLKFSHVPAVEEMQ